jgi:hypothetical protein
VPARYYSALVAFLLSAVATTAQTGTSEADAVKQLEARKVKVGRSVIDGSVTSIALTGPTVGDDELRLVGHCRNLQVVEFEKTKGTDAGLKTALAGSAGTIHTLLLEDGGFTDAVIPAIAGLKELSRITLSGRMTDAGLVHLDRLRKLRSVTLDGPGFTDAGLVHLRKLSALDSVVFFGPGYTDATFGHLAPLPELDSVTTL